MIVVELTAAIDAIGTTQTFYVSNPAYVTSPTDTPPNTIFEPRLIDPGNIDISIYRDGPSGGASTLELGEILFANIDGAFDSWKNYSFDGRPLIVRVGNPGDSYPLNFTTVFIGTVASITLTWEQVVIDLRDKAYIFSLPILTDRFLGTNVPATLPATGLVGLEGIAADIGGTLKPMVIGYVQEISPPCVNTALLTYRVHSGPIINILNVFVRQASMARGPDYPNSTQLQSVTVNPGTFSTCLAEGLFRLGSQDGQVTCNVFQSQISAAQAIQFLALRSGLSSSELNQADVLALHAKNPAAVGIYINDTTTYLDAMNRLAQSIGAWFAFDTLGQFRMGRLEQANGHPIAILQEYDILTPIERTILQNEPTPLWSVTLNYQLIYNVQTSGLIESTGPDRRAFLSQQYRTVTKTNVNIQNQFKLAGSISIDTLLVNADDTGFEALRMLNLHSRPYDVFNVPINIDRFKELTSLGLGLGREIALDIPRFGLSGGFSFIVLGLSYQRATSQVALTLWGGNIPAIPQPATVESIGLAIGLSSAFTNSIYSAAGTAAGFGTASTNTSGGIISATGNAPGQGTGNGRSTNVTGTAGQPFGLLLLITKAT